jgi:predicted ester cyclase
MWRKNMMPTAEPERNKVTLRRLMEAMNTNDADIISNAIDEFFEPDALISTPSPVDMTGVQAQKVVLAKLLRAYPDLHVDVQDVIAEGDKVVVRDVVTGTHKGEYMGIAPTGKAVTYNEIFVMRFVNGRIAETWGVVDVLAQMRQLGVIPASRGVNGE